MSTPMTVMQPDNGRDEVTSIEDALRELEAQTQCLDEDLFSLNQDKALPLKLRSHKMLRRQLEDKIGARHEQLRILQATARRLHEMRCGLVSRARKRRDLLLALSAYPYAQPVKLEDAPPRPERRKLTFTQLWLIAFGMLPPSD